MSMPIFSGAKAAYSWASMKFGKVNRLCGVRTNSGRPLSMRVTFSPDK